MKVMVTGSGGREHALAWRAAQSAAVESVYVAPGNAGTAREEKLINVDMDVMNFDAQIQFARDNRVDLTIIGPEAPLVAGVVDRFKEAGLACFGPNRYAAQLEGSKAFTKLFLEKYQVPVGEYANFECVEDALAYIADKPLPIVIKADGLAAGKGVVIARDRGEAESTVRDMLSGNAFGEAGSRIVIEEYLVGEEASFIVMADGNTFLALPSSQDHKTVYDNDKGPNTGGMGAYSPAPVVTPETHKKIVERIIKPTLAGMKAEGHPYTGFLYAGLMIDDKGDPRVFEFNSRFGDPEAQPIMMRMQSDLPALCLAALDQKLDKQTISFDKRAAVTVVMSAGGYPEAYDKGDEIHGLDEVTEGKVFHAGTRESDGVIVTSGGRVLSVTCLGDSVSEAREKTYKMIGRISFRSAHYRNDIGYRAVARES
ncbi:MAG: phosphoribosylamine--glycine ligase [Pseudomonadales bacterium]